MGQFLYGVSDVTSPPSWFGLCVPNHARCPQQLWRNIRFKVQDLVSGYSCCERTTESSWSEVSSVLLTVVGIPYHGSPPCSVKLELRIGLVHPVFALVSQTQFTRSSVSVPSLCAYGLLEHRTALQIYFRITRRLALINRYFGLLCDFNIQPR